MVEYVNLVLRLVSGSSFLSFLFCFLFDPFLRYRIGDYGIHIILKYRYVYKRYYYIYLCTIILLLSH